MNDVQLISGSPAPFSTADATSGAREPTVQGSLLLDPPASAEGDALADLLLLQSRGRTQSMNRAIANIGSVREQQRTEWEKQKAALLEAASEQESSSFWGDVGDICGAIGKVAAVAASVAFAVTTAGAGTPFVLAAAGACLSAAAMAQGEFQILQKLGVDAETAGYLELGIALGGAGCTVGAAFWGGASSMTKLQEVVRVVGNASAAAAGLATMSRGGAMIANRDAQADADECYATAAQSQLEESRLQQMLVRILDDLEESEASYRHAVERINGAVQTGDQTLLIAAGRN